MKNLLLISLLLLSSCATMTDEKYRRAWWTGAVFTAGVLIYANQENKDISAGCQEKMARGERCD